MAVTKLTQKALVNAVSDETGITKSDIKEILDIVVKCAANIISEAGENNDIEVKVATGLSIGAKYVPPREARNPKDQSVIHIDAKLKPYAKFNDGFKSKLILKSN